MTQPAAQRYDDPAPPQRPVPVTVTPELAGPDLNALLDRLEAAKARVAEAEADRDQVIADVKARGVAVATAVNGGAIPADIRFPGTPGRPAWQLLWKVTRKFSTKRFEAEQPALYEAYREAKGGWVLGPQG
jgi:hypothetical protein